MLHHRTKASTLAAVVTLAFLAGCSSDWSNANPENQGYQWQGQGEPTNFGSTYDFCRNTVGDETSAQRQQVGGPLTTLPGGPNIIPGDKQTTMAPRGTAGNRRQFNQCMASQGWVAPQQTPDSPQLF